jgi:Beta-galactosidase
LRHETSTDGSAISCDGCRVFDDPLVSGVALAMRWDTLEPAPNTFDWSALDCVFAQADSHHKFVTLAVTPGFESPSWVLQLPGVQTQTFKFAYFTDNAPPRPLPLPWNAPYLHAWFTFLGALADRYANNPDLRLIGVGGPSSVSTEMSLPGRKTGDTVLPPSAHGSDIAEWIALGYTPVKYVNARTETFDRYHELFRHQHLGLALYPALPIGNNGTEDRHEIDATRLSVIAAGMRYKHQFDLQENGVRGGAAQPSDFAYTQVRNRCGEIVT